MRSRRQRQIWLAIALLSLAASPARAQKKKLSLEDLTADPPLSGRVVTGLAWLPSGTHFSFIVRKGSGEEAPSDLVVEDAKTGTRKTVVKAESLALPEEPRPQEVAPGVEKQPPGSETAGALRATPRARRVSLEGYRWSPDGGSLLLSGDNDLWLYRVADGRLERLTHDKEKEEFPMFSPDGRRVAFVRKNDLYLLDLESKMERRLTSDGGEHVFNGRLDWVYEEELASRTGRAYEWAPDSLSLAYLRSDESRVASYPIVDFLKVPAAVTFQRYPKSGTANSTVSFRVVGTDGSDRGHVEPEGDAYIEPAFSWTPDSNSVCYRVLNRAQDRQDVRLLSVGSGASRTLFVEEDPYWLNVTDPRSS